MSSKRHKKKGPGGVFLAVFFLLINLVAAASPVWGFGADDYKNTVSNCPSPVTDTREAEEGVHISASSFAYQLSVVSFRHQKQTTTSKRAPGVFDSSAGESDLPKPYVPEVLPTPGYYSFLFRYNLF